MSAVSLAGHAGEPRGLASGFGQLFVGFANEFVILRLETGNVGAYPMNGTVKVITDNLAATPMPSMRPDSSSRTTPSTSASRPPRCRHRHDDEAARQAGVRVAGALLHVALEHLRALDRQLHRPVGASPAGSESGWGLNIEHQGDVLFITWFT